jgi:subtilisin family serine protease
MKFNKLAILLFLVSFLLANSVFAASDPYYSDQWYLSKINAPQAWQQTMGSSSIVVAVLDTGTDLNHPDLEKNIWQNPGEIAGDGKDNDNNGYIDDAHGWDFVHNQASPEPSVSGNYEYAAVNHGTFISGLISAVHNNGRGIKGVTANVKIMPIVVLDSTGYGNSDTVASAINYAVANGADVINLSFGGYDKSTKLKNSITNAYNKNVIVVAAAGNAENGSNVGSDMTNNPIYPICYDKEFSKNMIIGVVATDKDNKLAEFSNYGSGCIDIAAPGQDLVSLLFQNSSLNLFKDYYGEGWNGTSFSAAMVSATAALLKSKNSSATADQVISAITEGSGLLYVQNPAHQGKVGSGLLDVSKALSKLGGGSSPVTPTPTNSTPVTNPSVPVPVNTGLVNTSSGANIFVSTKSNGLSSVMNFNSSFNMVNEVELLKGDQFQGLNIYMADINGGQKEIITGATKGGQPFVRALTIDGVILSSFLAFDADYKGGVEVAAGDVDNDGEIEILAAPESSYVPVVRVFKLDGKLEKEIYIYNKEFTNGLNIAVGDVDGDGKNELVTAPHGGILPKVKIFDENFNEQKSIIAYVPQFTGGVNISLADVDNNGILDIVTGPGVGGGPHVKAFNYSGTTLVSFFAYKASFAGGIEVKGIDWDKNGTTDIITAAGPGGGPHVKVFSTGGSLMNQFFPLWASFTHGINIEAY